MDPVRRIQALHLRNSSASSQSSWDEWGCAANVTLDAVVVDAPATDDKREETAEKFVEDINAGAFLVRRGHHGRGNHCRRSFR